MGADMAPVVQTMASKRFSIVVPCYNESASVPELIARVEAVMSSRGWQDDFEIVFADDGSTDETPTLLAGIGRDKSYVRTVRLRCNSGKALALMAAFRQVRGAVVVTMDGDLQDNPEDIPTLVDALDKGFDMVSGHRQNRQDTLFRRLGSKVYNGTVRRMTGLDLHDMNCGFKAYRREVVESVVVFGHYHRYIPLQAHLLGWKVGEAPVSNSPRRYGQSRYRAFRYEGLFDFLSLLFTYRYAMSPMHFFGKMSLIFILPCSSVLLWMLGEHFVYLLSGDKDLMLLNRPMLLLALIGWIAGILVFLTGFLCDFILHHNIRSNIDEVIALRLDRRSGDQPNRSSVD